MTYRTYIGRVAGTKRLLRLFGPAPVTRRHAWTMDPNLTDRVCFTTPERLGIDYLDLGVESRLAATDERACALLLGHSFDNAMLFERSGADGASGWRFCAAAAAHFQ